MASYGMFMDNPQGVVIINERFRNLGLTARGYLSNPGGAYPKVQIVVPGDYPLLFTRATTGAVSIFRIERLTATTWRFTVSMRTDCAGFDYYVFDKKAAGNQRYGARVWNASEVDPIYDSGNNYLKLKDFINIPENQGASPAIAIPAGTYAALLADLGKFIIWTRQFPDDPETAYYSYQFGLRLYPSLIQVATIALEDPPQQNNLSRTDYYLPTALMLADVSGI